MYAYIYVCMFSIHYESNHISVQCGGANYLCLPDNPEYLQHTTGSYNRGYLCGAEYETGDPDNGPLSAVNDHNVPWAVCYVPMRGTVVMIPAKTTCPTSWTREYYGYLMTNYYAFHRTMYECVDKDPESIPGSATNRDGTCFYHVETRCKWHSVPSISIGERINMHCVH